MKTRAEVRGISDDELGSRRSIRLEPLELLERLEPMNVVMASQTSTQSDRFDHESSSR
jgi:hypothetical protein